jgi:peptidoglycan/LPS O-acetylase OafA/YrhL
MRGLAILLVVVYHAGPLSWRLASYDAHGRLALAPHFTLTDVLAAPLLHFGFAGVHAFFVLSGFCIHLRAATATARGEPAAIALGPFFRRRFWRIYPPYWIALALFAAGLHLAPRLGLHLAWPPPGPGDVAAHAAMLHTLSPHTFFSIDPAFWSLATEEQFYLAYPLLARALARFGAARVLAVALVGTLAWRLGALALLPTTVDHFMDWRVLVHGLIWPRWYDWILGCLLAERVARRGIPPLPDPRGPGASPAFPRRRPLVLVGALLVACAMATRLHIAADKLGSDVLFATAFFFFTAAALAPSPRAPSPITRALAAIGRRAYGIYLVHQPLLDLLALPLAARALLVTTTSALFARFCERPFEARSRRVR